MTSPYAGCRNIPDVIDVVASPTARFFDAYLAQAQKPQTDLPALWAALTSGDPATVAGIILGGARKLDDRAAHLLAAIDEEDASEREIRAAKAGGRR